MAYRITPILAVFVDNTGAPLAGGTLKFYEPGTTTAKSVYNDEALTVNLGNEVTLDSAGRAGDVWGDADYRVRLYDSDGAEVDEADPVTEEGSSGMTIPTVSGQSGKVLSNNGSILQWTSFREVPDPTGHAGKLLSTDATNLLWKSAVELGLPTVTEGSGTADGKITIGAYTAQFGHGTLPIPSVSPPHGANVAITFATAFASVTSAFVTGNKNSVASHDYKPVLSCEATTTSLTVQYNINENSVDATADVGVAVPFSWMVIGKL